MPMGKHAHYSLMRHQFCPPLRMHFRGSVSQLGLVCLSLPLPPSQATMYHRKSINQSYLACPSLYRSLNSFTYVKTYIVTCATLQADYDMFIAKLLYK